MCKSTSASLIAPSSSVAPSTVFVPSPNKFSLPSTTLAVTPGVPAAFTTAANAVIVVLFDVTVVPFITILCPFVRHLLQYLLQLDQLLTQSAVPTFTQAPEFFVVNFIQRVVVTTA